jgi:hypothetical protein
VDGADDFAAVDALQVDARDGEVGVSELSLDHDERDALVRHLDCVRVPQLVRREPTPDGRHALYFLPDRVLVRDRRRFSDVTYNGLGASAHAQRFIETDRKPRDARQVDTTWQYVNVKRGPDRRYKNNRQIPVMLYGKAELATFSGLHWLLQCSTVIRPRGSRRPSAKHPLRTLAVARPAVPEQLGVCTAIAPPRTLHRDRSKLSTKRRVILGDSRLAALRRAMLPRDQASPPLRHAKTILKHQVRLAPARRAHQFPFAISLRPWMSSAWSATIRFNDWFSRANSFKRLTSSAFIPPYCARQR